MKFIQRRKTVEFFLAVLLCFAGCKNAKEPLWRIATDGRVYADLVVDGETMYAFSQKGEVLAANTKDGKQLWKRKLVDGVVARPVIKGAVIYLATQQGNVMRLRTENGAVEWQKNLNDPVIAPLQCSNRSLLVPSETGTLYALNPSDGSELWRSTGNRKFSAAPLLSGERILIGTWDRKFLSLKQDGSTDWSFETADIIAEDALLLQDKIFVPAYDRYVYALQAQTGKLLWRVPANRPSNLAIFHHNSSGSPPEPAIVFASGTDILLVSSASGRITRRLKFGKIISRVYSNESDLYVLSGNAFQINPSSATISVAIDAAHPLHKLTFATGMILAVDDLYSIYGYAPVQD